MDLTHAPQSSESDDDIIDLTDIVEKGAVPAASADAGSGENPLEAQMADLLAGPGKVPAADEDEFDLDALLKASGLGEEGAPAAPDAPAAPADEELDMPDMGEVDALLRDLVAPEQPPAPPAAESAPASGGSEPEPAPETPRSSPAAFEAVLQEHVASVSGTAAPVTEPVAPSAALAGDAEVDVDDLDSLLDSIMNPDAATPAVGPEAEDTAALDDLDALLNAAQADVVAESAPSAGEIVAEPLEPVEVGEPMAEVAAVEAAVADAASLEDAPPSSLESESATEQKPEAFAPAGAEEPAAGADDDFDLDALLSAARVEMMEEPAAPAAPEAPLPAAGDGDDDPLSGLDALFAAESDDEESAGMDMPLESDLGDPLLVGESEQHDTDLSVAVLNSLDALAADIAAMQDKINAVAEGGGGADAAALDDLRERVDDMTAEVREVAERHASGLAAAEARISALEAELAEQGARKEAPLELPPEGSPFRVGLAALIREAVVRELREGEHVPPYAESMSEDIVRLEDRVGAVETAGEKAAAEAAARVIREEIAALLAEMGSEG